MEHEADVPVADVGEAVLVEVRNVLAGEDQLARARNVETADDVHQRRLARPGWADDGDELAVLDAQVDAPERLDLERARPVGLADVDELDDCRLGCQLPRSLSAAEGLGAVALLTVSAASRREVRQRQDDLLARLQARRDLDHVPGRQAGRHLPRLLRSVLQHRHRRCAVRRRDTDSGNLDDVLLLARR